MKNLVHLAIGFSLAILGVFSLVEEFEEYVTLFIYIAFIIYVSSLVVACAVKSKHKTAIFPLPDRTWALLLVAFLFVCNICSFGNLYIQSEEVRQQVGLNGSLLREKSDAIYFSVVTLTTLGYGDFVPVGEKSRRYVVYQLGSGVLLFLFVFPIVASRLSDLD